MCPGALEVYSFGSGAQALVCGLFLLYSIAFHSVCASMDANFKTGVFFFFIHTIFKAGSVCVYRAYRCVYLLDS